jgi:hypothetical protein
LLNYGECDPRKEWDNYIEKFNFTEEHIPELIRMATDEQLNYSDTEGKEVWAPTHAWRSLAQLKATSAIKPLLPLLNERDDDWISSDFSTICTMIGLDCVPFLQEFLADSSNDIYGRSDMVECLKALSDKYPETRENHIEIIVQELEKFKQNDPIFNSFLISALMDFQAIEYIDLIEQVFRADLVDTFVTGDWDDVQVHYGLKSADEVSSHRLIRLQPFELNFSTPHKLKTAKGFASKESDSKKSKSSKSSKKKKKQINSDASKFTG